MATPITNACYNNIISTMRTFSNIMKENPLMFRNPTITISKKWTTSKMRMTLSASQFNNETPDMLSGVDMEWETSSTQSVSTTLHACNACESIKALELLILRIGYKTGAWFTQKYKFEDGEQNYESRVLRSDFIEHFHEPDK